MPDSNMVVPVSRAEELNAIGAKFFGEGQVQPARLHFLAALALEPNNVSALQNLGASLRNLMHFEAAASVARRSVAASNGTNPFCRSNLGVSYLGLKQFDKALEMLASVLVDLPESGPSWHNYGLVLYMIGRYKEALAAFETSILYTPDNPHCHSDRALTLLSLGNIAEGLAAYEMRWKVLWNSKVWQTTIPEWKGEDLAGRRIILHHEQGFGDSIMLVRFVGLLADLGATITIAVPKELVRLFDFSFGLGDVVELDELDIESCNREFDYHSPLLSVMRWLNIARPNDICSAPYLSAPNKTVIKLPQAKVKIGICWASGNHGHSLAERRRIVDVTKFLPLTELYDVSLISLQKGTENNELVANGLEGIIFDVAHKLEDFADTADVISKLDLVISVDSAVAHLTGALGKPILMLSPYSRCWRWWDKTSGLPWYEDMLQYHQSEDGTWNEAMDLVIEEVKNRYMG